MRWFSPLLPGLVVLAFVAPMSGAEPGAVAPRPNIVLILADDMGFSDVGCYGSEIATPNIDQLAKEGLRYTQFYNAPRCCPSRASLLTGLYPHQAGIGDMVDDYAKAARAALNSPTYQDRLNRQCVTLAEALRAGGYATFMSGKWHQGSAREAWPDRRGFEQSFALISGGSNYFGFGPQNNAAEVQPFEFNGEKFVPPRDGFFTTDAFTEHAVEFIKGRDAGKPFFLYLAYNAPHWPLQELPENIAAYEGKYMAGWDALREARHQRQKLLLGIDWTLSPADRHIRSWEGQSPEQKTFWDRRMAIYAAQVSHMDQGVGQVMEALRAAGVDRNTLVVFLSDNGACAEDISRRDDGELGTRDSFQSYRQAWGNVSTVPFRRFKHWTHEGGISTPMVARWPEGIAKPGLRREVGSILDFMPTFLQLAGAEYPKTFAGESITPMEGRSLLPTFRDEALPPRTLYWEHEGNRAVLDGQTKLVAGFREPWQLFDLADDRTELHDLAADQSGKVKELAAKYDAWAERCGVRPWELTQHEPSPGAKSE